MVDLLNCLTYNDNLFSGVVLPDGLDSEELVNQILGECGMYTPIYTNPMLLEKMITLYFKTRLPIHQKLYNTTVLEYNPIENYDRKESNSRTLHRNTDSTQTSTSTGSEDMGRTISETESNESDSNGTSSANTDTTSTDSVSPYNDDNWHNSSQNVTKTFSEGSNKVKNTGSFDRGTDEAYDRKIDETGTMSGNNEEDVTDNYVSNIHGNIGVTTTQQMIESERNVSLFSVYDFITQHFKARFFVLCR